ncbi:hypothetical protein N185_06855 [Sinorhizobium sp. GW3]|nr:hypothetical protein N185_06855 [Sinorhizobium sp. GW3]
MRGGVIGGLSRTKLQIVTLSDVNAVKIICGAADRPVGAKPFAPDEFVAFTMKRDKKHIERLKHHRELRRPAGLFENVLQQEIVAG